MANSRYDRLDNSSPSAQMLKAPEKNVPRSAFDLSHIVSGQALFGALIPVLCEETVPGQELDINIFSQISFRNPSIRPLLNGCKVQFHAFYNDVTDLWEGAKNYYDTGRSGKINLSKPNLLHTFEASHSVDDSEISETYEMFSPMSLADYFGIPPVSVQSTIVDSKGKNVPFSPLYSFGGALSSDNTSSDSYRTGGTVKELGKSPDYINALPFMAYQRNWRDYFSNKNLLQNNKLWFPDNEDHFILSYDCSDCAVIDYEKENQKPSSYGFSCIPFFGSDTYETSDFNSPGPSANTSTIEYPVLASLKFRQFRGDRFTTASPFPDFIRGDEPTLGALDDWILRVNSLGDSFPINNKNVFDETKLVELSLLDGGTASDSLVSKKTSGWSLPFGLKTSIGSRITSADINAMNIITAFKTKMGMTNGDYNEMIKSQFGYSPNVHDRKGTYIGGFTSTIDFSSVSQTSESSSDSPLGTKSGQCFSNGQGRIGHFRAPNFGYVSVYMSIIPDTYYCQGIPKMFSKQYQKQEYFPILNGLAPDAILNKELFVSGKPETDNDVFAYCEKFEEFKSRRNRVCGFSSLSHQDALFDSALVMKRYFNKTPQFNHRFLTMTPENLDMDVFYFNNEPPFDFSVGFDLTSIAPIPYKSIPKTAEA